MTSDQRNILWVAILASFVAFLDGSIVNVALPAISGDLGGGLATQQWVLDSYLLTLGSLILVAGSLSDNLGRVRVLRAGLALFGLASIACALAPTDELLILARFIQGVGAALLVPSSLALITSGFSGPARAKAIGMWTAWTGLAFVVGPLLGGVLVDTVGWRVIFAINVVPIAVTLLLLTRLQVVPPPETRVPIDVVGAILAALGLAGPVFALIEGERLGWGEPIVLVPLVVGVICLALFLWREATTPHPMLPLGLFRTRNFAVGNIATVGIYAALSLGLLIVTLFLQEVAGFSAIQAGLAILPLALASLAFATLFGGLAGKHGPRLFMAVGPLVAGSGFLWMLSAELPINFWLQLFPGILLFSFGLSMTVAPLTAAVLGSIRTAQSGIGSAVNNAVSRVAGLIAIALTGTIVGSTLDVDAFHRVALVTALLFYAGGIASAIGIRNEQLSTAPIPPEAAAFCRDRVLPAGTTS